MLFSLYLCRDGPYITDHTWDLNPLIPAIVAKQSQACAKTIAAAVAVVSLPPFRRYSQAKFAPHAAAIAVATEDSLHRHCHCYICRLVTSFAAM